MERYFRAIYDGDLAYEMYKAYLTDKSIENDLIKQICPLVRKISIRSIGKSQRHQRSTLEADGLSEALRIIRARCLPEDVKQFTSFLYTSILREMMDAITRLNPQVFEAWKYGRPMPYGKVETHDQADDRIFMRQFKNNVVIGTVERFRFEGRDKDACVFILHSLMGTIKLDASVAKSKFSLPSSRYKFLYRYVTILLRSEIVEQQNSERRNHNQPPQWEASRGVLRPSNKLS